MKLTKSGEINPNTLHDILFPSYYTLEQVIEYLGDKYLYNIPDLDSSNYRDNIHLYSKFDSLKKIYPTEMVKMDYIEKHITYNEKYKKLKYKDKFVQVPDDYLGM